MFAKTKAVLGEATRIILTGQAPIKSLGNLDYLKICFCNDIVNGYGLTESCGASISPIVFDPESGHVGGPMINTKIRLRDLPELGYLTSDSPARGEICLKGSSVSPGYFNKDLQESE